MHRIFSQITISLLVMGATARLIADESPIQSTNSHHSMNSHNGPTLYRAVYTADYKGLPVRAKGIRELSRAADGSYKFSSSAKSFFASVTESSTFKIKEKKIVPLEYQYHRSGIGKNRDAILSFDWEKMEVLNNVQSKPWLMPITASSLDKLIYQLKMREDLLAAQNEGLPWPKLSYEIADGGKLKQYEFEIVGEELVKTRVGDIKTIKINRIKHRRSRTTTLWLAPEYDFLLIRLKQVEGNGKGFELLLREGEFNGKAI